MFRISKINWKNIEQRFLLVQCVAIIIFFSISEVSNSSIAKITFFCLGIVLYMQQCFSVIATKFMNQNDEDVEVPQKKKSPMPSFADINPDLMDLDVAQAKSEVREENEENANTESTAQEESKAEESIK